jgi:hypothetical protein
MTNSTKTFTELTIAEKFSSIAETVTNSEMAEFLQERANATVAKNAKKAENRKPTKVQLENLVLIDKAVEWLEENAINSETEVKAFSANQIFEGSQQFGFTAQKQSALLKKAIEQGRVEKVDFQVTDDNGRKKVAYTIGKGL